MIPIRLWISASALLIAGCSSSPYDRNHISAELVQRAGAPLAGEAGPFQIPSETVLDDGLTEPEAVGIALWNNARLQSDLATLGLARADLFAAGAFPNPVLDLLFPSGAVRMEATVSIPIDLLSRWSRVKASREDVHKVAANLVAVGLQLARDVRIAHAEHLLARDRLTFLNETSALRRDIADIGAAQFEVGRINQQIYSQMLADGANAEVAALTAAHDLATKENRLLELLGAEPADVPLVLVRSPLSQVKLGSLQVLVSEALIARPEIEAGEASLRSAGARANVETLKLLDFIGKLKIEETPGDTLLSPGGQITVPLFDQNQAGRTRAAAELERVTQDFVAVRQSIRREVADAYSAYVKASQALALWQDRVLPSLEDQATLTRASADVGRAPYLELALAQDSYVQGRLGAAEAEATFRRASAQLAYSVGHRIAQEQVQ